MSFFVWLPSNHSLDIHTRNTCANFIVDLPQPIELDSGKWVVGLSEIFYPSIPLSYFKTTVDGSDARNLIIKTREVPSYMFVYCNIVSSQLIGTTRAPVLRVLATEFQRDKNINSSKIFEKPHYLPLASNLISSIEIKITTQTGNKFPFPATAPTILVLHFKKLKNES
jgi:hypothetical protein